MTVSSTTNRVSYTGNGVTTAFSTSFPFLLSADINVYVAGILQTETTHYTVSGGSGLSGTVTFLTAPATGAAIVFVRNPAATQTLDLVENGPLPAEELEKAFDKVTILVQRQADLTSRAVTLSDYETAAVSTKLPVAESGKILTWSADGLSIVSTAASSIGAVGVGGIGTVELADSSVTTAKLADSSVTAAKLVDSSVTAAKLVDSSVTAAKLSAGAATLAKQDTTGGLYQVLTAQGSGNAPVWATPARNVRQTVLSGPVDSSGFSSFGGSTGSTTVTATGTLIATAMAGGTADRVGSITNPSWTGLSTNGTMYLYLDVGTDSTATTGSATLAPVYQHGGTYSTTSGQFTLNIQEATAKVGNGSTAAQVYRVFVGQVTVSGGVTTAIVWYALNGMYESGLFAVAANTAYSKTHNIGVRGVTAEVRVADDSGGTNERAVFSDSFGGSSTYYGWHPGATTTLSYIVNTSVSGVAWGTALTLTAQASGYYRLILRRSW